MNSLTINIDPDTWDGTAITVTRTETGGVLIQGLGRGGEQDAPTDETPDASAIEEILGRWKKQNPHTGAFEFVAALKERGLGVVAPTVRKEGKDVEPYLRLLTRSQSGVTVRAYINTDSLVVSSQKLRAVAAKVPGADVRSNGNVHFPVGDQGTCMAVVDALLAI